jgi:hypothetical protein
VKCQNRASEGPVSARIGPVKGAPHSHLRRRLSTLGRGRRPRILHRTERQRASNQSHPGASMGTEGTPESGDRENRLGRHKESALWSRPPTSDVLTSQSIEASMLSDLVSRLVRFRFARLFEYQPETSYSDNGSEHHCISIFISETWCWKSTWPQSWTEWTDSDATESPPKFARSF